MWGKRDREKRLEWVGYYVRRIWGTRLKSNKKRGTLDPAHAALPCPTTVGVSTFPREPTYDRRSRSASLRHCCRGGARAGSAHQSTEQDVRCARKRTFVQDHVGEELLRLDGVFVRRRHRLERFFGRLVRARRSSIARVDRARATGRRRRQGSPARALWIGNEQSMRAGERAWKRARKKARKGRGKAEGGGAGGPEGCRSG